MKNFLVIILAIAISIGTSNAQSDWVREDYITGFLSSGYFPIRKFEATGQPMPLPKKVQIDQEIVNRVNAVFDSTSTNLAVLMIDKGQIVLEKYKDGLDEKNRFFSYSMSKSLTAYTLGYALCSGSIRSLDDKAGQYAPEIAQSVFGQATIRELLMMSSGARPPDQETGSANGEWNNVTRGFWSSAHVLNGYGSEIYRAKDFVYNNSNTNALMLAVDGVANLGDLFETKLWQPSKPEASSTWLKDKDNHLYAAAGFGATLRDWGRLAMRTIRMLKGDDGKCIANYMAQATTIQTQDLYKKAFFKYGYQTWINPYKAQYVWLGAYGQSTTVDPKSEKIMIVFRNQLNMDNSRTFGRIYFDWTNN